MDNDLIKVAAALKIHDNGTTMAERVAQLIRDARIEAVGWAWSEACVDVANDMNIRERDMNTLIERVQNDLVDNVVNVTCSEPIPAEDKQQEGGGTGGSARQTFYDKLTELLNCTSQENFSDTPDYVLSEYLINCLHAYELAVKTNRRHHEDANQLIKTK